MRVDTVIRHVPRPRHFIGGTSCRFAAIVVVPTGVLIGLWKRKSRRRAHDEKPRYAAGIGFQNGSDLPNRVRRCVVRRSSAVWEACGHAVRGLRNLYMFRLRNGMLRTVILRGVLRLPRYALLQEVRPQRATYFRLVQGWLTSTGLFISCRPAPINFLQDLFRPSHCVRYRAHRGRNPLPSIVCSQFPRCKN